MSRILPPTLWIAMLASIIAIGLLQLGPRLVSEPISWAGWVLLPGGLAITILASRQFQNARTNIDTFKDPDRLVTNGLFAISRNPMYLGFAISLLGAAIGANRVYALGPTLLFFMVSHLHYIPFEERAARRIFGEEYEAYRRRVRKWI